MTDEAIPSPRPLSEAARRALAEAEARRAEIDAAMKCPREILGRSGPEPIRYGDWENKGIASDF
jgi:hypothetical protein